MNESWIVCVAVAVIVAVLRNALLPRNQTRTWPAVFAANRSVEYRRKLSSKLTVGWLAGLQTEHSHWLSVDAAELGARLHSTHLNFIHLR